MEKEILKRIDALEKQNERLRGTIEHLQTKLSLFEGQISSFDGLYSGKELYGLINQLFGFIGHKISVDDALAGKSLEPDLDKKIGMKTGPLGSKIAAIEAADATFRSELGSHAALISALNGRIDQHVSIKVIDFSLSGGSVTTGGRIVYGSGAAYVYGEVQNMGDGEAYAEFELDAVGPPVVIETKYAKGLQVTALKNSSGKLRLNIGAEAKGRNMRFFISYPF